MVNARTALFGYPRQARGVRSPSRCQGEVKPRLPRPRGGVLTAPIHGQEIGKPVISAGVLPSQAFSELADGTADTLRHLVRDSSQGAKTLSRIINEWLAKEGVQGLFAASLPISDSYIAIATLFAFRAELITFARALRGQSRSS